MRGVRRPFRRAKCARLCQVPAAPPPWDADPQGRPTPKARLGSCFRRGEAVGSQPGRSLPLGPSLRLGPARAPHRLLPRAIAGLSLRMLLVASPSPAKSLHQAQANWPCAKSALPPPPRPVFCLPGAKNGFYIC